MFATGFVNLYTADIEAGLRFYRDLLGFAETFRAPKEGVVEHVALRLGDFALGLGTVEAAKRVHGVDASPGSPAMVVVVWTDDVDAAYERLASAGVPVVQPPRTAKMATGTATPCSGIPTATSSRSWRSSPDRRPRAGTPAVRAVPHGWRARRRSACSGSRRPSSIDASARSPRGTGCPSKRRPRRRQYPTSTP